MDYVAAYVCGIGVIAVAVDAGGGDADSNKSSWSCGEVELWWVVVGQGNNT